MLLYLIINNYLVKKKHSNLIYISLGVINVLLLIVLCYNNYSSKVEKMTQKGGKTKTKRQKLLDRCGMPDNYSTSHCFADATHHTCCKLGPKAREYADKTGNPIGEASVRAFKEKFGREPESGEKTGWCTCFGSKVCSTYGDQFPGDTKIKFINKPQSKKEIRSDISNDCEEYFREKYSVIKHGTPGVHQKNTRIKNKGKCEETSKLELV